MATQLGEAFVKITTRLTSLRKGLFDANKMVATAARNMGAVLSLSVSAPLALMAKKMIEFSGAAEDSEAKFEQVMGSMADSVRAWSKEMNRAIGISEFAARDVVSDFTAILRGSELSTEAAAKYSTALVELAADMRAFKGGRLEDALAAIRSGLSGMVLPLKRFGIDITGLSKSGDKAADSIKRLDEMFKRAGLTGLLGQAAREAGNFTGVMLTLNGAIRDITTIFGSAFLPTVTKAIKLFNMIVAPIAKFVGETLAATKITKFFVIALGLLAIVIGPLLLAVGQMALAFNSIRTTLVLLTGSTAKYTGALATNTAALKINTRALSQGALMMGVFSASTTAATAKVGLFSRVLTSLGLSALFKWAIGIRVLGVAFRFLSKGIALLFGPIGIVVVGILILIDVISVLWSLLGKTEEQANKTADAIAKVGGGPGAGFGGQISQAGLQAIGGGGFASAFAGAIPAAPSTAATGGKEVPRKAVVSKLDQILDVLQQGVMLPMRLPLL